MCTTVMCWVYVKTHRHVNPCLANCSHYLQLISGALKEEVPNNSLCFLRNYFMLLSDPDSTSLEYTEVEPPAAAVCSNKVHYPPGSMTSSLEGYWMLPSRNTVRKFIASVQVRKGILIQLTHSFFCSFIYCTLALDHIQWLLRGC